MVLLLLAGGGGHRRIGISYYYSAQALSLSRYFWIASSLAMPLSVAHASLPEKRVSGAARAFMLAVQKKKSAAAHGVVVRCTHSFSQAA